MSTFMTVLLIILGICFIIFVVFFGRLPALRRSPIATLNRAILVHVPNGLLALDKLLTAGRFTSSLKRFGHFVVHDRHPTVLIFFILILAVSEALYLPGAWPQLSPFHKVTGSMSIALPYIFLYLCAAGDPGYISHENHAYHMQLYPYDFSIFYPGHECRTCRFLKPARSKHCGICKRCVSKMDHHCIFINKCVGYKNHQWFILLLLSTAVLASYGALMGISLLSATLKARYPLWSLWPPRQMELKQYLLIWGWGMQYHVGIGSITLLTILCAPMVWGLLGYSLYLVYCGTTTNESLKWSDWQAEMDDGFAFRRRMCLDREKDSRIEPLQTRWPTDTEQVLTRTDGMPPGREERLPGEGDWERVWKLRQVDNMYDLGFRDNLVDIFVPNYQFNARPEEPAVERSGRKKKKPPKGSPF